MVIFHSYVKLPEGTNLSFYYHIPRPIFCSLGMIPPKTFTKIPGLGAARKHLGDMINERITSFLC
jgi:hypothetical protein